MNSSSLSEISKPYCPYMLYRGEVKELLYELRTYEIAPGRMNAIIDRFASITMKFFRKHGVTPVLYLEPVIGKNNELIYLLKWNSLAERERCWNAFMSDPEWIARRTETERDGPIVLSYTSQIFKEVPSIIDSFRNQPATNSQQVTDSERKSFR